MKAAASLSLKGLLLLMSLAWGQIPQTISYQGVLKDNNGAIVTDGQYDLTFRLFDVVEFGYPLWVEDHNATTVTDGVFSVILGSITPISRNFDSQYWLEIDVNGTVLPRTKLTASPYSLASRSVGGGTNIFPATGNVGIGTASPGEMLEVFNQPPTGNDETILRIVAKNPPSGTTPGNTAKLEWWAGNTSSDGDNNLIATARAFFDGSDPWPASKLVFQVTQDGSLVDVLTLNNGNVGIGTISPVTALEVSGTVTASAFSGSGSAALDFQVNGARALRLEPNATSPNIVGGYSGNYVTSGVYGATIGGGGESGCINQVTQYYGTVGGGMWNASSGDYATVLGGHRNTASAPYSTVSGGIDNTASDGFATIGGGQNNSAGSSYATIGGGVENTASGYSATVSGGTSNTASGQYASVGGGILNTASGYATNIGGGTNNNASGWYATVPGGSNNTASGQYSFAAGRRAKATHDGAFVWADQTDADFASTASNQFLIRASGGVGIDTTAPAEKLHVNGNVLADAHLTLSSRRWKTNITPIEGALDKVQRLRGVTFDWKADGKHDLGLIAEEVGEVVPEVVAYEENGTDAKSVDYARLVALLIEGMKEQQREIETLAAAVKALESRILVSEK